MAEWDKTVFSTNEKAVIAAKNDAAVIDAGGFVTTKVDGGYAFLPTTYPQGDLSDLLGPASGKTAEVVERHGYRGGGWMKLGSIETEGNGLARERLPETETGSMPP